MSYIKPDNLEVIQNFLQDAGPRGQISPEDTSNFVAPITVGLAEHLDDFTGGSWTKRFVATEGVLLDTEAGFSDSTLGTEVIFKTPEQIREGLLNWKPLQNEEGRYIPQLIIGDSVLNAAVAARIPPVRIHGEAEGGGMDSRPLVRIPEIVIATEIKPAMANVQVLSRTQPSVPPQCSACGGDYLLIRLSPPNADFDGDLFDEEFMAHWLREKSNMLRGLLRSKTKKGPKRKWFK